jgi:DnaJ-like protein
MTREKPPGKSWDSWIEELIDEANADGTFDNLPGAGKPLPGIDKPYDPDWWVKQLVQREQITALPPALELLRKVESTLAAIWVLTHEADVRRRIEALNAEIGKVNGRVAEGPPTRLSSLDVESVVEEWRRRSRAKEGRG